MRHSKRLTVLLLASLWGLMLGTPQLVQAEIVATTEAGALDGTSPTLSDGGKSYLYQTYPLTGTAGETLVIDLLSQDFNAFLLLADPDGNWVASDNNSGNGTNARITFTLPADGTYAIWVTTHTAEETGSYELRWRSANANTS